MLHRQQKNQFCCRILLSVRIYKSDIKTRKKADPRALMKLRTQVIRLLFAGQNTYLYVIFQRSVGQCHSLDLTQDSLREILYSHTAARRF